MKTGDGRVYRPKATSLKWGSSVSPQGSGFGYLTFELVRQVGKDWPDIGYGYDVKLRKGLTKVLFHGVVTKVSEKRADNQAIEVGCVGKKIVLDNDRLNRVYADTRTGEGAWDLPEEEDALNLLQPAKFDIRSGEVLELRPRQRVDFLTGEHTQATYSASGQAIEWIEVFWATVFPTGYPFELSLRDGDGTSLFATTTDGEQSGCERIYPASDTSSVLVRLTITDDGESTAADDAAYAQITSIVVSTQSEYPVDMAVVAKDVVAYLAAQGHDLSDDVSRIEATGRALHPALFLDDQTPREILEWCAGKGSRNGLPLVWGLELNDRRRFFLREQDFETVGYYLPRGEAETTVEGDVQESCQKLYAAYRGADDSTTRTADSIDQDTIAALGGYFRRDVLKLDGNLSSTLAGYAVALALNEKKRPVTSSSWSIRGSIYSSTGKRVPFDEILPGTMVVDRTFVAREANMAANDLRNRSTKFYLVSVEVDYDSRVARLVPGSDAKNLERYLSLVAGLSQ